MKSNLGRIGKEVKFSNINKVGGSYDRLDEYMHAVNNPENVANYNSGGDITEYFAPIRGRTVDNETYMGGTGTADYDGPIDVNEIFFDIGASGNYKLYIRHKNTIGSGGNFWANDIPIFGIQILDEDGDIISTIEPSTSAWQTTRVEDSNVNPTPSYVAANETFYTLTQLTSTSGGTYDRFYQSYQNLYATSTASQYVGARGGIPSEYLNGPSSTPMPVGHEVIQQDYGRTNMFFEASGAAHNYSAYLRTTNVTAIPARGSIKIAFIMATNTTSKDALDHYDSIFIGLNAT